MMRETNSNSNCFIDFNNFVKLNIKSVNLKKIITNLKDTFFNYELDINGLIMAKKLLEVLKSLGDECNMVECKKIISRVDNDNKQNN